MKIKLSRSQWEEIGNKAGWMSKESQSEDFVNFMDSLDSGNPAKLKPAIRMVIKDKQDNSSFGILAPERKFDEQKLDEIFGKHEFNANPQTIIDLAKRIYNGVSDWKTDKNSGYILFVDGKPIHF